MSKWLDFFDHSRNVENASMPIKSIKRDVIDLF